MGKIVNENGEAFEGGQIIKRATIVEIVSRRDHALREHERAWQALHGASSALAQAYLARREAAPQDHSIYNDHQIGKPLPGGAKLPERETFVTEARKQIDTDVWAHIIRLTELERLMDKKAKDQFRQQLQEDPPEVTVDNVTATLQQFLLDAGTIFKRGIAECFSNLDRRFKSHDGWKIGGRVILTYAFTEHGSWNWNRNHEATLMDVERVFRELDENRAGYCEILELIRRGRRGFGAHQTEVESQYFTVRIYKNGNCHIWFKRDDLLERVNQLLGEYYDAPIPEDRAPSTTESDLFNAKTTPAKNYGFYPTPDDAVTNVMEDAQIYRSDGKPKLTVLEPSAGSGQLARACVRKGAVVDCVELQPHLAETLERERIYRKVRNVDFLRLDPSVTGLYDRVVMNPPFDRERDIDHVLHALKFLKPDGHLIAIMSAGTEFRETKKSIAFRALIEKMGGKWRDMPERSFASVGTNCNTIKLRVWKNRSITWW